MTLGLQYHTFIRVRDQRSLAALSLAKETFKSISSEECSVRSKLAELAALLYNTAASVNAWTVTGQHVGNFWNTSRIVHLSDPYPYQCVVFKGYEPDTRSQIGHS